MAITIDGSTGWTYSDNIKHKYGTGDDLQIYHDGSNSFIEDEGTGGLILRSQDLTIQGNATTENLARFIENGKVELYYDNVKTFETTGGGGIIRGTEGGDANLFFYADEGDDNADQWRVQAHADGAFKILNYTSGSWETSIRSVGNGAAQLYYDNVLRLGTNSDGAQVFGSLYHADNSKDIYGDGSDLQIYHTGSKSYIKDAGTGSLRINSDDFRVYNAADDEYMLQATENGPVDLYYDNVKKLATYADGVTVKGDFWVDNQVNTGKDIWFDESANYLKFYDTVKAVFGDADDLQIHHDGSNSFIDDSGTGNLYFRTNSLIVEGAPTGGDALLKATEGAAVDLYFDNSKKADTYSEGFRVYGDLIPNNDDARNCGKSGYRWNEVWAANGTIQTSDRNEKNTILESDLGLDFINNLKPISYKWNKDEGTTHYGLIAQDLEEVLNTVGKPISDFGGLKKPENALMGLDYSQLISPLIKAIQELSAKVEALEAG